MALDRPYKRCFRPLRDGGYFPRVAIDYTRSCSFSENPRPYIQGFLRRQEELKSLLNFIEPSDNNLSTYSIHLGELLSRICFEVEASLRAILKENGYANSKNDLTMKDYKKIESSHRLSQYKVFFPEWTFIQDSLSHKYLLYAKNEFSPFKAWSGEGQGSLEWYQAYNVYKHDRVSNLKCANFQNVILAFAGLFALICSQYGTKQFVIGGNGAPFDPIYFDHEPQLGVGNYLSVILPQNWREDEKYGFEMDRQNLDDDNFCSKFDYSKVSK